jgi:hypothetical protein
MWRTAVLSNVGTSPASLLLINTLFNSLSDLGATTLQNGHLLLSTSLPWWSYRGAWQHPLHIVFPQHAIYLVPDVNVGRRRKQIRQSSSFGGCLNSFSSCSSAIRLSSSLCFSAASLTCSSHCFLCLCLCFFLHVALQYFTILHLLHILLAPFLLQLAHVDILSSLSAVLIFFNLSFNTHTSSLFDFDDPTLQILSDVLIICLCFDNYTTLRLIFINLYTKINYYN